MKRPIIIFILTCFLVTLSLGQKSDDLYLNYVAAIENESTFQYFLVIKVKNLNSGLTREYCTTGNFLKGAIHRENNLSYNNIGTAKVDSIAIGSRERYFEFKNDSAIQNIIGFWSYSMEELAIFEKNNNIDKLAKQIISRGNWSKKLIDKKLKLMYAHALFNRGVLTGENKCYSGTIVYVDRNSKNY